MKARYISRIIPGSMMDAPEKRMIRILLVEEEALVRAALRKLLESWPRFEVVGETGHKDGTLAVIKRTDPDIILLGLPSDEAEGLDIFAEIAQVSTRSYILVLMVERDPRLPLQLVRLGARGVVFRRKGADELRKAIVKICEGREIWLDRASLTTLITEREFQRDWSDKEDSRIRLLTHREREIVAIVCRGFENKEVGQHLFISPTTVRHHLTRIFRKLEVRNRVELMAYLHRHRFPDAGPAALRAPAKSAR